jgi:4a-hydroxytetrahydrobiopterin dehydratase
LGERAKEIPMKTSHSELAGERCTANATALNADEVAGLMALLPKWSRAGAAIERNFKFKDFHATIGFVNALAWVANREDHHPDLGVGYDHCKVTWSTHSAGGLTRNDFICAARSDALVDA